MNAVIRQNNLRAYLYMGVLTLLIVLFGYLISTLFDFGLTGTGVFLVIAGIINFIAFFFSDRLIIKSNGAKPLLPEQAPEYVTMVKEMCAAQKLPLPKLYYVNEDAMNAFATGRDPKHAAVVVTKGLLEKLTIDEVRGVVGHELSHIRNFDTRLMAIVAILAGLVTILADMYWTSRFLNKASEKDRSGILSMTGLLFAVVAPLSAMFIQLAISRRREFAADALSAHVTKAPNMLASALQKISRDQLPLPRTNPATAHLFFSNPFKTSGILERLFSTHPPIEERINLLERRYVPVNIRH